MEGGLVDQPILSLPWKYSLLKRVFKKQKKRLASYKKANPSPGPPEILPASRRKGNL
jgi:hypothetical protein